MSEHYQSLSFQQDSKDQFRSSVNEPIFDKSPEHTPQHVPSRRSNNPSETETKQSPNLVIQDLHHKPSEPRSQAGSQRPSERQQRPPRIEDYHDDIGLKNNTIDVISPSHIYHTRSVNQSTYTTVPTNRVYPEMEHHHPEHHRTYSGSGKPQDNLNSLSVYSRLESEILNLKKKIEKFDKLESEKERDVKKVRSRSKADVELLNKTYDSEESDFKLESKKAKSKSKKESRTTMKSPTPKTASKTIGKNRTLNTQEERIGTKGDRSEIIREDRKKSEKRAISKLKGDTTVTAKSKGRLTVEEKYEQLKEKYRDLRVVCREYVEKAEDLEEILKSKDRQLENYEEEIRKRHEALLEKGEAVADLKRQIASRDKQMENMTREFEHRLKEQQDRAEKQLQMFHEKERENKVEKDMLIDETRRLGIELEAITQREAALARKNDIFQQEIEGFKLDLTSKSLLLEELARIEESRGKELLELKSETRKLRVENDELRDRNREIDHERRESEDSRSREKRLYEDHLERVSEERERETAKQREKLDNLKEELKKAWSTADAAKEEKDKLEIQVERFERQRVNLEEDLIKYKEKNRQNEKENEILAKEVERNRLQKEEAVRSVQYESEKANRTDNENRKLDMAIKTIEGRLNLKEKEAENLQEMNDKMRDEMKGLVMEIERTREYTNKIERDFNSIQDQRNEEAAKFERRIEKMTKEIQLLNEESRILKVSESRLNRELNAVREEKDRYQHDYRELRQTNKTLEKDLRELDGKVKDVINSKPPLDHHHQRENRENRENRERREDPYSSSHLKQSGSKMKVLDEIQDMIKGYKVSQSRFENKEN